MYLKRPARQWFQCIVVTNDWIDTAAVAGLQGTVGVEGLQTVFLNEFVQKEYPRYQETKLRSWKQGIDQPPQEYFFEVVKLCRQVDLALTEAVKLNYL